MKGVYVQGQLKLDTERSSFSAHDRSISNREKTPVMDSQHSTDAEETPTSEALRHGNRILARGLMVPRSGAVCSCSHAPPRPRHSGSFVDQRRTSLHTTKEIFNIRSPWALREVLDGPIDMKLRPIQHQAKMAAFRPRRSLRREAGTPLFSS